MSAHPEGRLVESTKVLLARVREGDPRAREQLIARYLPVLQRWARGRLPPYARGAVDTDDLVQDSLLRALNNLECFEPRREGAFLAYLRQILLNRVREEIRRCGRHPPKAPFHEGYPDQLPSAVERAIGKEAVERYEAALEQLEEEQREAVILRLELGLTHEEVAGVIGSPSANAARMVVSRALVRLARVLDAGP